MATLGRNFTFRQSPIPQHRLGRFKTGSAALPQGAPVRVPASSVSDPGDGRLPLELATAAPPVIGLNGILVWEEAWTNFYGQDPVLIEPSDLIDVPARTPAQLCHGTEVRVLLVNTVAHSFEGQRNYAARLMVDLTGVAIGDVLTPGTGNDTAGYWAKTTTAANAWLRVTAVSTTNGFAEAQMVF